MMSAELCMCQRKIKEICLILPTAVLSCLRYVDLMFVSSLIFVTGKQFLDHIGSVPGLDGLHIQDFKVPFHIYQVPTDLASAKVNYSIGRKQELFFGSTS